MATRKIVKKGDDLLRKKSREVTVFDKKLADLLDDMAETMHKAEGVGIAAPQVGILRRAVIVEPEEGNMIELVNPVILSAEGEGEDTEGCLSVPGVYGYVKRPTKVVVRAYDRNGEEFELEAEDFAARAVCHELDHLEGTLFIDKVTRYYDPEEE